MLYKRDLSGVLDRYSKFPVVAIMGPRQSGKTTISKNFFNKHKFVSLENPQERMFAKQDPERFLGNYENRHGIIIDEFQYVPELLSYIQLEVDNKNRPGYFVLTSSQNFLMNQAITQSLAGRVGIVTLLPLSLHELLDNNLINNVDEFLFKGGYPRLYKENITPHDFYSSYLHTYIERDVRQLANVGDILIFQKFMRACAARTGQLLNVLDISSMVGVDQRTIKNWISVLEASYIIFILKPHFNNFNKRLTKTPKLYFYDTGLACSLLDIQSIENLLFSPHRGHLFESAVISDFYKQYCNLGRKPSLYFWRDQNGRIEVDCLVDRGDMLIPVKIKAGETISNSFFKQLLEWNKISDTDPENNNIVYAGKLNQNRSIGKIISWKDSAEFVRNLYKN